MINVLIFLIGAIVGTLATYNHFKTMVENLKEELYKTIQKQVLTKAHLNSLYDVMNKYKLIENTESNEENNTNLILD